MSENAVDYLKFAAGLIFICESELRALHDMGESPNVDAMRERLNHMHTELRGAAARFCPGDGEHAWARYSDGRRVVTGLTVGNGCYAYTWHPDRAHPANAPSERGFITTPDGTSKRVVVSAPGFLDAVTLPESAEASEGQQALAQTE
jgi:hypothetical protein